MLAVGQGPHQLTDGAAPAPSGRDPRLRAALGGEYQQEVELASLQAAADVLDRGQRVAILAGAGALHAGDELMAVAVAERLGAGVAKALLGKGALPDDLPHVKATAKEWSDGLRERK